MSNAGLDQKVEAAFGASTTRADAVAKVRRTFIRYDQVDIASAALERLLEFGAAGTEAGGSASTFLLTGQAGSGKTSVLKRFCKRHPMTAENDRDVHPVVYVEVPPSTSLKALAQTILLRLGAMVPIRSTGIQLTNLVGHHLLQQGVRLLILDEAQHLVNPEKRRLNYEVAEWVKGLANLGTCAIALAGMPEAAEILRHNPQLARRAAGQVRMRPLRAAPSQEFNTFRNILGMFERTALPFSNPSGLNASARALQLHLQCGGYVGRLADFLAQAVGLAVCDQASYLDVSYLKQAADERSNPYDEDWENPFLITSPVELQERVEAAAMDIAVTQPARGGTSNRSLGLCR